MRKRLVTALALTALLPGLAAAQQLPQQRQSAGLPPAGVGAPTPAPRQPMAEVFNHPKLGFSLVAPPGATIAEKAEGMQVAIRSPKGFAINMQSGPARPDIPLERMPSLLESRYLGEGRPWNTRGTERALSVGGLPAYEVNYSGTNSQARVVVARGPKYDYVFIYMAPHQQFVKLAYEFDWVLEQFKPSPQDLAGRPPSTGPKADGGGQAPASAAPRRFAEPGFGFAIEYPDNWEVNKPADMAAVFSGPEGTPAYAAIIGVQNIQPAGAKSGDESVARAVNQLKSSLGNAVTELKILRDAAWTYQRDGRRLLGRQVTVSYVHAGARFRKHLIVIPRPSGTVAHVWSYTAPEQAFASFQPVAARMLSSWRILTADVR